MSPIYIVLLAVYVVGIGGFILRRFRRKDDFELEVASTSRNRQLARLIGGGALWPLWIPFVAVSALMAQFRAMRDKKPYKELLLRRSAIQEEYRRLNGEIAALSDAISRVSSEEESEELLRELDGALRARSEVGPDHPVYEQLDNLYWRHREIFDRDSTLGGQPQSRWNRKWERVKSEGDAVPPIHRIEFAFLSFDGSDRQLSVSEGALGSELLGIPPLRASRSEQEVLDEDAAVHAEPTLFSDSVHLSIAEPEREEWEMLHRLDKNLQGRILSAIMELLNSPVTPKGDTVKPLTNKMAGMWRYRIGDYRLIYLPKPDLHQIVLIDVAARGSVYQ